MTTELSRRAKAKLAKKRGSLTFIDYCKTCGKNRKHYVSNTRCLTCEGLRVKRYRADPEIRAKRNASSLKWSQDNPGPMRESAAAKDWREATGAKRMHAWYTRERKAMQAVYAGLFGVEKFKEFKQEGDHLVPKVGKAAIEIDGKVKVRVVVNGLHTFANLGPMPAALNREKRSYFNPEQCRHQRPANRFPGGAFDPEPTAQELEDMRELRDEYGVTVEESLRNLRASLDRLACAYEKHLSGTFGIDLEVPECTQIEISSENNVIGCTGLTEVKPCRPLVGLGSEAAPDEETVQALMPIASHEILQMQSEEAGE